MLRKRFFGLALATLASGLLLVGAPGRADAGIRVTLSGAGSDLVFYSQGTSLSTPTTFTYDGYTGDLITSLTNFPGGPLAGTLSTTFNVTNTAGTVVPISINTAVVADIPALGAGVYSTTGAGATNSLSPGQLGQVNSAALLNFTSPVGTTLTVSADVGRALNTTVTSGTAQTITTTNGLNVATGFVSIVGVDPAFTAANFPNPNGSGVFNLQQTLNITGLNVGASAVVLTASSAVGATGVVPEPSTLALGLLGIMTAAGTTLRRKIRSRQA